MYVGVWILDYLCPLPVWIPTRVWLTSRFTMWEVHNQSKVHTSIINRMYCLLYTYTTTSRCCSGRCIQIEWCVYRVPYAAAVARPCEAARPTSRPADCIWPLSDIVAGSRLTSDLYAYHYDCVQPTAFFSHNRVVLYGSPVNLKLPSVGPW